MRMLEAQDITENTDCLTLLRIERDNKFNTIPIKIADDNLGDLMALPEYFPKALRAGNMLIP